MPLRCVIDNMIFDKIVAEPGLTALLTRLTAGGKIELLVTSRQEAECRRAARPDLEAVLDGVPVRVIGSAPFLLDVSQLDVDRLGPAEPYDTLRQFASSPKHINDHLGVATAHMEMLPFVTAEKRLHGFAAQQPGVTIWSWKDLRQKIAAL